MADFGDSANIIIEGDMVLPRIDRDDFVIASFCSLGPSTSFHSSPSWLRRFIVIVAKAPLDIQQLLSDQPQVRRVDRLIVLMMITLIM